LVFTASLLDVQQQRDNVKIGRQAVARELFLDREARPRAPKSGTRERETEVYAGIGESFCPENKRSPKK